MWIKELSLSNIQCFEQAHIEFAKNINILVGKNNSGKSAIIRSLLNFQNGGIYKPELLLRKFESQGFILATIEEVKTRPTLKDKLQGQIDIYLFDTGENKFSWMVADSDFHKSNISMETQKLRQNGDSIVDVGQFSGSEPNNLFHLFLAKRKPQGYSGQFDEEASKKIEQDLRGLPTKLSRARANTLGKSFEKACQDILGFIPSTLPGQVNFNLASIGHYVGVDESVNMEQMGDGVAQVVGLLVNLFQAQNKIFLIEEVENDLHPYALKMLLNVIIKSSQKNQFIISTHSNIVVRVLGAEYGAAIFETKSRLIEDTEKNTSMFTSSVESVKNTPDEKIRILNDLGYDLLDFHLLKGYLILEESSAEKIIKDFLIPCFCPRLIDCLGTIAAKGAGDVPARFSHLQSMLTYLHSTQIYKNKAWVCVDGDEAGKETISKMIKSFEKEWTPNHFVSFSKRDFEEFYPADYAKEIEAIQLKTGKEKGFHKLNLAKAIVAQYRENKDFPKMQFGTSAQEVIDILREIEKHLLAE